MEDNEQQDPPILLHELDDPPGFRRCRVVEKWGDNLWVRDKLFITIPRRLLDCVVERIGRDRFDYELLELEYGLSEAGDKQFSVGFWGGHPIVFYHLSDEQLGNEVTESIPAGWQSNSAAVSNALRLATVRAKFITTTIRGFLGWLMTNPLFLDEHDALFTKWKDEVFAWGIPTGGLQLSPFPDQPDSSQFINSFAGFFKRWRLTTIAAPFLPVPQTPQLSGLIPDTGRGRLESGLFHVPDTFPIGSRDDLRMLLDDAIHSEPEDHLTEWSTIVSASNFAKNPIARYARLFKLQHYCRLFHQRHSNAINRNLEDLERALAHFLGAKVSLIHQDLIFIRKRLGPQWFLRGSQRPKS